MTSAPRPPVASQHGVGEAAVARRRSTASAPCARATRALSSLDTVPITRAPSAFAQLHRNRPTPPAAACTSTVSPARTRCVRCSRYSARHALQHQRRGGFVVDVVGQRDDRVGRQRAHVDVRARRRAGVGDAIARQQVARRLRRRRARRPPPPCPGGAGGSSIRYSPAPHVDVDVVDADRRVPDAHLAAAPAPRAASVAGNQHLGTAVAATRRMPRAGIASVPRAPRPCAAPAARAAGTRASRRSRLRRRPCRRGRRTRARGRAARRTSTPSARTCGRRR